MACLIGYDNNQFIGTQIGTRKDFKKYDLGFFIKIPLFFMVSRAGLEPATCPLGGGRAIQLRYRDSIGCVDVKRAKYSAMMAKRQS